MERRSNGARPSTIGALGLVLGAALTACLDRPVTKITPITQNGVSEIVSNEGVDKVDLVVMVDNSGSMAQNQLNILAQLGPLINTLVSPPCVLRGTTGPNIACSMPNAVPQYPAIKDLHVGIVSSDLGAPAPAGAPRVPGCLGDMGNDVLGDDGIFNPIARGPAEAAHLPWMYIVNDLGMPLYNAPSAMLSSCSRMRDDATAFPPFLTFCSSAASPDCRGQRDATMFTAQFRCNAALSSGGCGLESQLEAVYRALTVRAGAGNPNEGFLRDDALLAMLLLTDEEDGSVRDDARSVYDSRSMDWAPTTNLNLRFYLYDHPGDPADPTWNPDRYVNPRDLTAGFLGLKPGHPERIVFAAIAGVPLTIPQRAGSTADNERIDWDQLLGQPGPNGADDWYGRQHSTALRMDTSQGPISMRHNDRDTVCPSRATGVVPACYREGQPQSCSTYAAAPSRRIVEVARRFDESPLCNGLPCRNGLVRSVCANDFSSAMDAVERRIASRLVAPCLPRRLTPQAVLGADGVSRLSVPCSIFELRPEGDDRCPAESGRIDPHASLLDLSSPRRPSYSSAPGTAGRRLCEVQQVSLQPASAEPSSALRPQPGVEGWYYDTSTDPSNPACSQRLSYSPAAQPPPGVQLQLQCLQPVQSTTGNLCR